MRIFPKQILGRSDLHLRSDGEVTVFPKISKITVVGCSTKFCIRACLQACRNVKYMRRAAEGRNWSVTVALGSAFSDSFHWWRV